MAFASPLEMDARRTKLAPNKKSWCPRLQAICLSGVGPNQFCNLLCVTATLITLFILLIAVFYIGSSIEMSKARQLHDTDWVYESPRVCSADNVTWPTLADARNAGQLVRSCGECGQCSNAHDISIYWTTRASMTRDATACGMKAFFGGRARASSCMLSTFNMTVGCNECWVDNILCDLQKCVFACLLFRMGWGGSNNVPGSEGRLSECLECDERRCGPAFIACAGANRRRSGMHSDIERNRSHVCRAIDLGPVVDAFGQGYWQAQLRQLR